jgi:hypothetical protein
MSKNNKNSNVIIANFKNNFYNSGKRKKINVRILAIIGAILMLGMIVLSMISA